MLRLLVCWLGWIVMDGVMPVRLGAEESRAIWWWTSPEHAWGTEQVIGNSAKETAALVFLRKWNFSRIFGCYSKKAWAKPTLIKAWNERIHATGMTSELLLSENTWIFPSNRPNLLTVHIQRNLIEFNAAASPGQRFDGLHLDIEPHGLPDWKTRSAAERKTLLLLLRDTFRDVRSYLNEHGASDIPIQADLPVWFDQVGMPVGWESAEERDAWFSDLARSLAGISLMAYERDTAAKIEAGVSWELQNFKGHVGIGLEVSVGAGKTWSTFNDLLAMIETQEGMKPSRRIDVHDFTQFHDRAGTNDLKLDR